MAFEIGLNKSNSTFYNNAIRRNEDFFEKLYMDYKDRINYLVRSKIKKSCDAEDLVHDIFLKIWEYRKSIDHNRSVKYLVYKIALNTIFNYIKRQSMIERYQQYHASNQLPIESATDSHLLFNEINSKVENVIETCSVSQKTVFLMYWNDGLSRQEIAEANKISIRTVENHIYRTRKILKQELSTICE